MRSNALSLYPNFCQSIASWSLLLIGLVAIRPTNLFAQEDIVEFQNGTQLVGKVLAIRTSEKEFDFESQIGTKSLSKTYQFHEVHAVTLRGKRHVLTEKQPASGQSTKRSRREVLALINAASAEPDWYASVQSNPPKTLDLNWPLKPPKEGWNNQLNVGQYLWDIINPNPGRWQAGIKLIHEIADSHVNNPTLRTRDYKTLGRMYFELLQDYPRAAYWLQKGEVSVEEGLGVKLAECYWRLGSREMALEVLAHRNIPASAIKLLGEIGEIERALKLAKAAEGSNVENDARILAADVLRSEGRFDEAIAMYQKVLTSKSFRNAEYEKRSKGRAQDSIDAIQQFEKVDIANLADGRLRGSSVGYNGKLEVEATIQGGKIVNLEVIKHSEKQFYSAITDTPQQIISKQSVREIDGFSGATITSLAIVNATAKALASESKPQ